MSADVTTLGPSAHWTPAQVLAHVANMKWDSVLVIGYADPKDQSPHMYCSKMTREDALWLAEHAKAIALQIKAGV